MGGERTWALRFEYDDKEDVIFAYPCGRLRDASDALTMYGECAQYYRSFGRKIDLIVSMEMWDVAPPPCCDDALDDLMRSCIRHMVLVSYDAMTIPMMVNDMTDDIKAMPVAPDVPSALAILKRLRARRA